MMDHRIYGRLARTDLGIYGTRRFPKGQNTFSTPGPTTPTDPSANPLTISRFFNQGSTGPHALTERWSYTVPLRRRAQMQNAMAHIVRIAAAAPISDWLAVVRVERAGLNTQDIDVVRAHSFLNTIGAQDQMIHPGPLELFEGDRIFGATLDQGGGGSLCGYDVTMLAIEYDNLQKIDNNVRGSSIELNNEGYYTGGTLQQTGASSGSYRTIIRVEGGSGAFYTATGWADLGGGYYGRN